MSSSVPEVVDQSETQPPFVSECSVCNRLFLSNECFFCCLPCQRGNFSACQACVLKDTFSTAGHHPRPCFLDSRDDQPTFLPAPEIADFRPLVSSAKNDPLFKIPQEARKYFSLSKVEGISEQQLTTEDATSSVGTSNATSILHTVPNNYSLYEKLDPEMKDIRIFHLLKGSPDEPVTVLLGRFSAPWDQTPFVALSYRWGALDETRSIGIIHMANRLHDGETPQYKQQMLTVTANLEIALRGIRRKDQDLWLWVDAICINQGDLQERADQVSIMAEIYGRAANTIVWLGMNAEDAASAPYVRALAELVKSVEKERPNAKGASSITKIIQSGQIMLNDGHIEHADIVKKVANFFRDPWFTRVWVLQEVICTNSNVYVIANASAPGLLWDDLVITSTYLAAAFVLLKTGTRGLISPWQDITKDDSSKSLSILELFDAVTHGFQTTDQRDKLFSLLAIAKETQGMVDLSPLIYPNYKKSYAQVFIDFTRWCIHHYQSLHVLGHVTYADRRRKSAEMEREAPSWALSTKQRFSSRGLKLCEVEEYRAAADTKLDFTLLNANPDDKTLHLRGYRLFTVTNAEKVYFSIRWDTANELYLNDETTNMYFSGGVHWLFASLRGPNGKHSRFCEPVAGSDACSGKQILDQFLLMLTCGGWKEHGDCDHSKGIHRRRRLTSTELYEMFATYWINHGDERADPELDLFCPHVREILRPLAGQGGREEFAMILSNHATRKSLFVVDGGAGLGPPGTQTGDVVVALFGGNTPYILRQCQAAGSDEQQWEFIGECYLHPIMNGKQIEDKIRRQEPSEIFKLC